MHYFKERFIEELNEEGPVSVRVFEWPPAEVLQTMSPNDFDAHFAEWVAGQKQSARDRAQENLDVMGCLDRFNSLHGQIERQSVIPFVGAGMSRPTGFPLWGDFLSGLTSDFPDLHDQIESLVNNSEYEYAAQCLIDRMGEIVFSEEIQNSLGSRNRVINGPVQLLPSLFRRGCISTNFDYVLDEVYEAVNLKFSGEFSGDRLKDTPRRMAEDPHCIIRLHGEAESGHGRVLTRVEFEACYASANVYKEIFRAIISNCSLLFLGCSLSADRTLTTLKEIKQSASVETPRHYAFLPLYEDTDRETRRIELGEADIHPIWYSPENHDQAIEDFLLSLMEGGFHD